jgi:hypothetical protein
MELDMAEFPPAAFLAALVRTGRGEVLAVI